MNPEHPPSEDYEPPIRYSSFWTPFLAVGYVLFMIFCLMGLIASLSSRDWNAFEFMLVWLGLATYFAANSVISIEASYHSLKVEFLFRSSRDIQWSQVQKILIGQMPGQFCYIRYGAGLFSVISFPVDYLINRDRLNLLIDRIVRKADLSKTSTAFWAYRIYERKRTPLL